MSALPIVTGADTPILRQKTVWVPRVTKEVIKLLNDMYDTVAKAEGAGLAAPQVGSSQRLCLALINHKIIPLINPEIIWKSDEIVSAEEGCLSLPNLWLQVPRSREIDVRYFDEKGQEQERRLSDMDARVVQHEVDHLEGILIVDYRQEREAKAL